MAAVKNQVIRSFDGPWQDAVDTYNGKSNRCFDALCTVNDGKHADEQVVVRVYSARLRDALAVGTSYVMTSAGKADSGQWRVKIKSQDNPGLENGQPAVHAAPPTAAGRPAAAPHAAPARTQDGIGAAVLASATAIMVQEMRNGTGTAFDAARFGEIAEAVFGVAAGLRGAAAKKAEAEKPVDPDAAMNAAIDRAHLAGEFAGSTVTVESARELWKAANGNTAAFAIGLKRAIDDAAAPQAAEEQAGRENDPTDLPF